MENNNSGQSRAQQRERWRQNARNRSQRLSMEQRQHQLSRRHANYHQQISTGNNFASGRFQGTHDNEVGPSTRRINENTNNSTEAEMTNVSTIATTNAASRDNRGKYYCI